MHLIETESIGEIVGLLEILEDMNKPVDIARLDDSLDEERTTLMNLLHDTEALGFLNIIDGDIVLTDLGRKFLQSDVSGRKNILKEQIVKIEPFNSLITKFEETGEDTMSREDLEEFIIEVFPSEDNRATFHLITNWGRYAKIIDYDIDTEKIILLT